MGINLLHRMVSKTDFGQNWPKAIIFLTYRYDWAFMGIYEIQTGNPFYIGYRVYDTYVCEIYGRRGPEIAGVCLSVFISQLYILDRPMVTALLHNRRFLEFFSLFGSWNFWIESNRIRCGFA